jgi:hypothetical protein
MPARQPDRQHDVSPVLAKLRKVFAEKRNSK